MMMVPKSLMNGKVKQVALAVVDVALVGTALAVALYLRFDWNVPADFMGNLESLLLPAVLIHLGVFFLVGLYRRLWRYASVDELMLIVVAVSAGVAGTYFFSYYFGLMLPRSVYVIHWFMLLLLVGGSRISLRVLYNTLQKARKSGESQNVLVIGAGDAGVMVAGELKKHQGRLGTKVMGFVDDDRYKQGQVIQGIPVLGGRRDIPDLVEKKDIHEIVIAIPSAPYGILRQIIDLCGNLGVKMKTVPGIYEILDGKVNLTHLKEVEIEDLLRRPPVEVDVQSISGYLANKTVLVTGAGGSIGSELCRQVALMGPQKMLLLDHDEDGIFRVNREMETRHPELKLFPLIRDVQDRSSLEGVFSTFKPEVVFHAAAYKHVPLMEFNVEEAVRNNVMGSKNLMDLAEEYGTTRFVSISTDKAVNPTSVMGATKRVSEIYLQHRARQNGKCTFCAVRFGNVLGSRGSVVTLFKEQISAGGPVTVTHPEMTRYFMTVPESVQLVIQAGALGKRGEIFVLDMGEPVKIVDLARDMIHLSGLQPGQDVEILFTGIRPGEKLYEELFNDREDFLRTRHERIFIAPDMLDNEEETRSELQELGSRLKVDLRLLLGLKERPEGVQRLRERGSG